MNHTCPDAHTPFRLTPSLRPPYAAALDPAAGSVVSKGRFCGKTCVGAVGPGEILVRAREGILAWM